MADILSTVNTAAQQLCGRPTADLVILHPPYHKAIKFTDDEQDLSQMQTPYLFNVRLRHVIHYARELVRPGGFIAVVIGDTYHDGMLQPLSAWAAVAMQDLGLAIKSMIVKDIRGNEQGLGQQARLWRYRALAGGFSVFKHEYIIIGRKD